MSTHERAHVASICERCGTSEYTHTSKRVRDTSGWTSAGERKYKSVWGTPERTGLTHRGARWGMMCDACWTAQLRKLDVLCAERQRMCSQRVMLAGLVGTPTAYDGDECVGYVWAYRD